MFESHDCLGLLDGRRQPPGTGAANKRTVLPILYEIVLDWNPLEENIDVIRGETEMSQ